MLNLKPYSAPANHTAEVYGDDYFFEGKQGYSNYLDEKDILCKYGKNYTKVLSKYTVPGNMLDVGRAAEFILKGLRKLTGDVKDLNLMIQWRAVAGMN